MGNKLINCCQQQIKLTVSVELVLLMNNLNAVGKGLEEKFWIFFFFFLYTFFGHTEG